MPAHEAPCVELGSVPRTPSIISSPSPSEISSASSPEPQNVRATPLFRALAMPPPEPDQPPGQDELERRLPGYRRIVIPRELTLIELLKQSSGVSTDEEVLRIREVKLRVVAERVGLRRLHVLTPHLRSLTLDGSALSSLRDLGIGLVRLKILSVNRCGLTSLDGVWGLGALRELHASGNKLTDLQPLAALQKLNTLNLSDNPIAETSRLWTLGICSSLRKLTLTGTPAAESPLYRSRVASALPMLVYLDDRPLHNDVEYETDEELGNESSGTESDEEMVELVAAAKVPSPSEPEPGPSSQFPEHFSEHESDGVSIEPKSSKIPVHRRRPATTECAGSRPPRPSLPPRPKTAHEKPVLDAPTRLQILNTLMDEEWRCSGSKLTSCQPVCGNLARALRRSSRRNQEAEVQKVLFEQTVEDASRALAAEIPRAPRLEDWVKFKEETGIEIDIDFNKRPKDADPTAVIDRLERIEKETSERLSKEGSNVPDGTAHGTVTFPTSCSMTIINDFDLWNGIADMPPILYNTSSEVDDLFNDITSVRPGETREYYRSEDRQE